MITHHAFLDVLRAMGGATMPEGQRFVRDGNVVNAGGVMSAIEMSLWLVRNLYGPEVEARTRSYIAHAPPRDAVAGGQAQAPLSQPGGSPRQSIRWSRNSRTLVEGRAPGGNTA